MDCSTVVEVILEADQVSWTNQLAMGKVTCCYVIMVTLFFQLLLGVQHVSGC